MTRFETSAKVTLQRVRLISSDSVPVLLELSVATSGAELYKLFQTCKVVVSLLWDLGQDSAVLETAVLGALEPRSASETVEQVGGARARSFGCVLRSGSPGHCRTSGRAERRRLRELGVGGWRMWCGWGRGGVGWGRHLHDVGGGWRMWAEVGVEATRSGLRGWGWRMWAGGGRRLHEVGEGAGAGGCGRGGGVGGYTK